MSPDNARRVDAAVIIAILVVGLVAFGVGWWAVSQFVAKPHVNIGAYTTGDWRSW